MSFSWFDHAATRFLFVCLQNKTYTRELDHKDLKFRGRIRIQLKNEDGTPKYENYPTRKSLASSNCFYQVCVKR